MNEWKIVNAISIQDYELLLHAATSTAADGGKKGKLKLEENGFGR